MIQIREMCDGWDATATTAGGNVVLHFRQQPTEAEVVAAVADYEQAQAEAPQPATQAGPVADLKTVTVEAEDGTKV